ncbi:MAG: glycosyltransferase [Alphaproteobacteria bacterium]|nr:glycosyltransferase [Alphaproteobacteria bacterium]
MNQPLESTSSADDRVRDQHGRVLVVTSSFPRWVGDASGSFVLNLAQDLLACGWRVDVLAPHAPGTKVREDMDGVRVERFRYLWPARLETLCYGGGILGNLRHDRLNILKVPPLVLGEGGALLRRLVRRRYDVVNSHWLVPQGLLAALTTRLCGVRHVSTVHGSDVLALTGRTVSALNRFTLRQADAVTVNSAATRAAVDAIAPGLHRLRTIPMGIAIDAAPDADAVARIRARHRRGAGPLLVFVGRLVREKGVGDLIDALARLVPTNPDIAAIVVGEGPDRAEFRQRAAQAGVADRIAFIGQVPPDQALQYMAAGDIFVGPSWIEAFGLVFAEALSVGTPVIGTAIGGIAECVIHEKSGLLVAPRAPEALAAAVERFVADPEFASRTVQAGRAMVQGKLSRKATARAFSDLFGSVLNTRPDRAPRSLNAAPPQR